MTGDYVSDKDASRGWHGSVAEFLAASEADLLAALRSRHLQVMGMPPDGGQMEAWRGEYSILSATLGEIVASTPRA